METTVSRVMEGMGAIAHENGVAFRVWAPHADRVSVVGTFNDWSADAHVLEPEGNGCFALDVPGAKPGDEYRFEIRHGEAQLSRIDPYAREVTSSVGNSIIQAPSSFDWGDDAFTMPPHEELVLFQGQEFLQDGWFRDDRPLDWHLVDRHPGIVACYRDLVALRRNLGQTTRGLTGQGLLVFHVNDADNVLAFQRWRDHGPGDDVVVIVNMCATDRHDYRVGLPAGGTWHVRLDTGPACDGERDAPRPALAATDEGADGLPCSTTLTLPSYSLVVLSQNRDEA